MSKNIRSSISSDDAKRILGSREQALLFLENLGIRMQKSSKAGEVYGRVVKEWNLDIATKIVRKLFISTKKYKNGKDADSDLKLLLDKWNEMRLGPVKWPFSQGGFDDFVQGINSQGGLSGLEKDAKVKMAAIRYRRIY